MKRVKVFSEFNPLMANPTKWSKIVGRRWDGDTIKCFTSERKRSD